MEPNNNSGNWQGGNPGDGYQGQNNGQQPFDSGNTGGGWSTGSSGGGGAGRVVMKILRVIVPVIIIAFIALWRVTNVFTSEKKASELAFEQEVVDAENVTLEWNKDSYYVYSYDKFDKKYIILIEIVDKPFVGEIGYSSELPEEIPEGENLDDLVEIFDQAYEEGLFSEEEETD